MYETRDYNLFHLLPENRVLDPHHVRKLVRLIEQRNPLHLKTLDVTTELGIIDGQHRLADGRALGVPVYHKMGQQLSETAITTLNIARKNWKGEDYLHFWTVRGKAAYQTLTAFRQARSSISFSNAKMMRSALGSNMRLDEFNGRRWEATGLAEAEQVAQLLERIADEVGRLQESIPHPLRCRPLPLRGQRGWLQRRPLPAQAQHAAPRPQAAGHRPSVPMRYPRSSTTTRRRPTTACASCELSLARQLHAPREASLIYWARITHWEKTGADKLSSAQVAFLSGIGDAGCFACEGRSLAQVEAALKEYLTSQPAAAHPASVAAAPASRRASPPAAKSAQG